MGVLAVQKKSLLKLKPKKPKWLRTKRSISSMTFMKLAQKHLFYLKGFESEEGVDSDNCEIFGYHQQKLIQEKYERRVKQTQTDLFEIPEFGQLTKELRDFIDNYIYFKLKLNFVQECEGPPQQVARICEAPLAGFRLEWDDCRLPNSFEILWAYKLATSIQKMEPLPSMQRTRTLELTCIPQKKAILPKQQLSRNVLSLSNFFGDIFSFFSFCIALFGIVVHFYYGTVDRRPVTMWDWILEKLNVFFYIDEGAIEMN